MEGNAPRIWSLVLAPAVVTLLVTILRLVGELQHWNDLLFSNVAPGGTPKPGFVGVVWLVPLFGFWFGWKLRRSTGEPQQVGKSALRFAIGAGILIGGFLFLIATGLVPMPDEKTPGPPSGLPYMLTVIAIAVVFMCTAWPRLAKVLLLYGLLARMPVVAVTYLAIQNGWQTHHAKLPLGTVLPEGADKFLFLATPQLTFWIAATLMLGGLSGCLGARVAGRSAALAQ